MKSMKFIGCLYLLAYFPLVEAELRIMMPRELRANGSSGFGEASGKLLYFHVKKVPG